MISVGARPGHRFCQADHFQIAIDFSLGCADFFGLKISQLFDQIGLVIICGSLDQSLRQGFVHIVPCLFDEMVRVAALGALAPEVLAYFAFVLVPELLITLIIKQLALLFGLL